MRAGARSRQTAALLAVVWLAVACTHSETLQDTARSPSAPASGSPPPDTSMPSQLATPSSAPTPSTSATATRPVSAHALLLRLQARPFPPSNLPSHLHVTGVGVWNYVDAGHVGAGYMGSARVSIRSEVAGERVNSVYDVFDSKAHASAEFATADKNFRKSSAPGGFQALSLTPSTAAFCAPHAAPTNTATCWLSYGNTNGIVTVTMPSSAERGDGSSVLQAMLSHLVTEAG